MRIAIVAPFDGVSLSRRFEFPPSALPLPEGYTGAPLVSVLAQALARRGHRVAAITNHYGRPGCVGRPFMHVAAPDIDVYFAEGRQRSLRYEDGRWGRAWDMFAFERRGLVEAIRHFRPDIVHAHWTYEFAWAALDSGYPTLVTAHDSPVKVLRYMPTAYRAIRLLMARRVLRRSRTLTAVSPDLAADLRWFTDTPIAVVPNPIDDELARDDPSARPAPQQPTFVMVLNGWTALKNGRPALRGFAMARARMPERAPRLVCFGDGWQADGPAREWARREGVDAGVEFRGPVPHAEILSALRSATALVHPSLWEACSMAIAEAMTLGLPVIGGDRTDGVPWQLDDGRAGLLCDVRDARSIAASIERLIEDSTFRTKIAAAAGLRARELFAMKSVMSLYGDLYNVVLSPKQ